MRTLFIFLTACTLAAGVPLLPKGPYFHAIDMPFPGWFHHFEGQALKKLQLSEREKYFNNGFPGHIAKFTDGQKILVIRWVTQATRKLHPATDCFKGVGYQVRVLPLRVDNEGKRWSSFEAMKNWEKALVYERIFDNAGNSWSDVSAWYWAALSGKTVAPWWAITVVEFKNRLL
ncbi:MAG: hypothetical protein DRR19_32475 [Candidatus Parabeggiatoa sp. nov. 1]|nr:MAG: hypothetical protein DRR19_32475 [Gammaproteobacteria bacterium]